MTEAFKGSTSHSVQFELVDSTTGLPKTGKLYSDVTSAAYARTRSAAVSFSAITLSSITASFSAGGFIQVDATKSAGIYRVDVPDAAFATGADEVVITIVVSGCRTVSRAFTLVDWNKQVAAIPNAVAAASGGLLTFGTSTGQLNTTNGKVNEVIALTGHTAQTGDCYAVVNHAIYGNAQLVRSNTPANKLIVDVYGGADLSNNSLSAVEINIWHSDFINGSVSNVIAESVWNVNVVDYSNTGTMGSNVNAIVGGIEVFGFSPQALALFATINTGQTSAVAGSVIKLITDGVPAGEVIDLDVEQTETRG